MTYEELKAAYKAAVQKCSELENKIDELKIIERRYDMPFEETKRWYDGYDLKGVARYILVR